MSKRIKVTEKQAHLVKEITSEADSFESTDNNTRLKQLFDGYVKIIKRYINEINGLYNKITFEPMDLESTELHEVSNKCHAIIMNSHKIGTKFEATLKTLSDEEYDAFGGEFDSSLDDIRILLSHKADLVSDLVDLYRTALDQQEEFEDKLQNYKRLGEKYFADIQTISLD